MLNGLLRARAKRLGKDDRVRPVGFLGLLDLEALTHDRTGHGEHRGAGADGNDTLPGLTFFDVGHADPPPDDGCERRLEMGEDKVQCFQEV